MILIQLVNHKLPTLIMSWCVETALVVLWFVKKIKCHFSRVTVCHIYSDRHGNMTLVGNCPYLCTNDFYTKMFKTTNISDLCNRDIQQKRKRQMCERCLDNYAPSPFSYSLSVVTVPIMNTYNWVKYIVITYFPLKTNLKQVYIKNIYFWALILIC